MRNPTDDRARSVAADQLPPLVDMLDDLRRRLVWRDVEPAPLLKSLPPMPIPNEQALYRVSVR